MKSLSRSLLAALRAGPLLWFLAISPAQGSAALDPPDAFVARGDAVATVSGPGCCGDTQFTGRFWLAYELSSSGEARLTRLTFELDDRDVFVRGGFLDLFTERIAIRCGGGSSTALATGGRDGADHLIWPAGTIRVAGGFSDERQPSDSCLDEGTLFQAVNSADVRLVHRPAEDRLDLDGSFDAVLGGGGYVLHLQGRGRFENRPPQARLAFRYLDGKYPQEGCPAYWRQNENKVWEEVAEATSPDGLVAHLVSASGDPDGGRADLSADRWFDTRPGADAVVLGEGGDVGPITFGWGDPHRVELLSFDRRGAADAVACRFRVIDSTPPVVTPPPSRVIGSSVACGATPASSAELAAHLSSAHATDVVDVAPSPLVPLLSATGTGVNGSTFFPADGAARGITFRYRDHAGNTGTATSSLTVLDRRPPSLSLSVNRPFLNPDHKYWWIQVAPAAADDCAGAVTLRLLAIKSNLPEHDAGDIALAAYGTDDRSFYLFSRPAGPGVPRVYQIHYEARDAAGNARTSVTTVTVGP